MRSLRRPRQRQRQRQRQRSRMYTVAGEAIEQITTLATTSNYIRGNHRRLGLSKYVHDLALFAQDPTIVWTDTRLDYARAAKVWRGEHALTKIALRVTPTDTLALAALAVRFGVDTFLVQGRDWRRNANGTPKRPGRPRVEPTQALLYQLTGPVLTAIGLGWLTPSRWPTEPSQPYLLPSGAARAYRWRHQTATWDYP